MKIAVERGEGHCFYSIPSLLAHHSCFHALDFHLSPPVTGAHNTAVYSDCVVPYSSSWLLMSGGSRFLAL